MTTELINQMNKEFKDSFMKPKAWLGQDIEDEILHAGLDCEHDKYYCKLSADGYMDQTDLSGPFNNLDECAEYLINTYGNDSI